MINQELGKDVINFKNVQINNNFTTVSESGEIANIIEM
jgi:hypothetical protein